MEANMTGNELASCAMEEGGGILRLTPTWVPRSFCRPGKRIKLHPSDYYVHGLERGAIDERWFASTTPADNGPGTPHDEGLSYALLDNGEKILLRDVVEELKEQIIGDILWKKYGRWAMYSKFFDNLGPLPHHIHHREEHAALVGMSGKPEMYFFPAQVNNYPGEFDYTFFGLNPGATKQQLKDAMQMFAKGNNNILALSRAYKLTLDTGWDVPPGVLHAPGSLCTYEPQFSSDVFSMYQSVLLGEHVVPKELVWKNCPQNRMGDFDYLIEVVDWEANVDPNFERNRFMAPIPAGGTAQMLAEGYLEEWICYKCEKVSAKRLNVFPGQTVTIHDSAPYGLINIEGYGRIGRWNIETPTLIHYGQNTYDEFFVSAESAKSGIVISNLSSAQPLIMLKHFSDNPDLPILIS
jgi:hypothetical protein